MRMTDPILAEFDQEAATTERFLAALPAGQLGWRPHARSWTLGQLALHIAEVPGAIATIGDLPSIPLPAFEQAQPADIAQIRQAFKQSMATARAWLQALTDERALETWSILNNGKAVLELPRIGLVRAIMLNHWYHHRGQLSVYLRLLDQPVPAAYGESADEKPLLAVA